MFASIEGTCADAAREGYVDGTGDEDIYALSEQMSRAESNDAPVAAHGHRRTDEVIRGFPPNLTVICGLPSVGKSALLGTIIDNQLRMGLGWSFRARRRHAVAAEAAHRARHRGASSRRGWHQATARAGREVSGVGEQYANRPEESSCTDRRVSTRGDGAARG